MVQEGRLLLEKLSDYRLLHDRDPVGTLDWFGAVVSTEAVHNTGIALHGSNAVTSGKHLLSRKNSHLVCRSYICASIVQSLHGMFGSIYENSLRTDSGTVHCPVVGMFHQESLPVSEVKKIIQFIKQLTWLHSCKSLHLR